MRKRNPTRLVLAALTLILFLSGCSGLGELLGIQNGTDGLDGNEGPSVYLEYGSGKTRVYSGGELYLGKLTDATSLSFAVSLVNKTGHDLELASTPAINELDFGSTQYPDFENADNPLNFPIVLDSSGFSGQVSADETATPLSFTIDFSNYYETYVGTARDFYYKRCEIMLTDTTTNETFTLSFKISGDCVTPVSQGGY